MAVPDAGSNRRTAPPLEREAHYIESRNLVMYPISNLELSLLEVRIQRALGGGEITHADQGVSRRCHRKLTATSHAVIS